MARYYPSGSTGKSGSARLARVQFADLVYLDPPFNSNRDYNVIFRDESGNGYRCNRGGP